jgi:hypothetical protein
MADQQPQCDRGGRCLTSRKRMAATKRLLPVTLAILLLFTAPLCAHRLDEYLQATLISLDTNRMDVTVRLIPGIAVSAAVLRNIDTDQDGTISKSERQAYAERVVRELSVRIDGSPLKLSLASVDFPAQDEMREGLGEIRLNITAALPAGGAARTLTVENRHENSISVYLVNCLVPRDPNIRILKQNRNRNQSWYQLEYALSNAPPSAVVPRSVGFASIFRLGVRHIADGTDHLLFLLALLLPAPLLALGSRWRGAASLRSSVLHISKIVTAFTAGHSLTLALAAFGVVHLPARPVEVLIAVSILVSAAHALRPLFPGREALIAALFGLVHGLAFATTIGGLGLERWQRVVSVFAFNFGIEVMQLVVVAATLPSLLLLSRTPAYAVLRISGALFAGCAALGWIGERALNLHSSIDTAVNGVANHAAWVAGVLFASSLMCSMIYNGFGGRTRPWQRPSESTTVHF